MKSFRITKGLKSEPESSIRKLATIMFSDIVGFSAMMGENESNAIEQIAKWKIIHHSYINKHSGKAVKEIGDGYLVTFDNCLDAINCALDVKSKLESEPLLEIRIGIHLAEIIIQNNDVLGDGVNIASRIETSASPGSVHISESVYLNLRNKTEFTFQDLGPKSFKNIGSQIRIFEVAKKFSTPTQRKIAGDSPTRNLAIIPFKTKSKKEKEIGEEIIDLIFENQASFSQIALLSLTRVISIISSGKELYDELNRFKTDYTLEGKLSIQSNQLNLSLQIISVGTSYQVAAKTFKALNFKESEQMQTLLDSITEFMLANTKK